MPRNLILFKRPSQTSQRANCESDFFTLEEDTLLLRGEWLLCGDIVEYKFDAQVRPGVTRAYVIEVGGSQLFRYLSLDAEGMLVVENLTDCSRVRCLNKERIRILGPVVRYHHRRPRFQRLG